MSSGPKRRTRSRASSRGGAERQSVEDAAAFHRQEMQRARAAARPPPRSTSSALRAWLPADTLALCGAEAPLFLALDKLDDMVQRVRSEGADAQSRVLKRLEASLQVRTRAARRSGLRATPGGSRRAAGGSNLALRRRLC